MYLVFMKLTATFCNIVNSKSIVVHFIIIAEGVRKIVCSHKNQEQLLANYNGVGTTGAPGAGAPVKLSLATYTTCSFFYINFDHTKLLCKN